MKLYIMLSLGIASYQQNFNSQWNTNTDTSRCNDLTAELRSERVHANSSELRSSVLRSPEFPRIPSATPPEYFTNSEKRNSREFEDITQMKIKPIPISFPKKTLSLQDMRNDIDTATTSFQLSTSRGIHDPNIVNTPPTDFMRNLKERMTVYFTPVHDRNL
jgi:hypothetical protein